MVTNPNAALSVKVREFVKFRRDELADERRRIEDNANGLNGAALVAHGERAKVARVALDELERFASWLENGSPVFVAPLTRDELNQWRFAREHGAAVPPHIEEQLKADGR